MDKENLLRAMQGDIRIKAGDGKHRGKASRGDVKRVARLAGTSAAEDAYCTAVDTVIRRGELRAMFQQAAGHATWRATGKGNSILS